MKDVLKKDTVTRIYLPKRHTFSASALYYSVFALSYNELKCVFVGTQK